MDDGLGVVTGGKVWNWCCDDRLLGLVGVDMSSADFGLLLPRILLNFAESAAILF